MGVDLLLEIKKWFSKYEVHKMNLDIVWNTGRSGENRCGTHDCHQLGQCPSLREGEMDSGGVCPGVLGHMHMCTQVQQMAEI